MTISPGMTPIPSLPLDVIYHVIDEVHIDSGTRIMPTHNPSNTLKNCTLVSHSWRHYSQQRLFSGCIKVAPGHPPHDKIQQAVDFIEKNPILTTYINGVALDFRFGENTFAVFQSKQFQDLFDIINGQGRAFTTLKILGSSANHYLQMKKPLEHYTHHAYNVYCRSFAPFITCLHVENINCLPLHLINSCANLTDLSLYAVEFADRLYGPLARGHNSPKLKKLDVCIVVLEHDQKHLSLHRPGDNRHIEFAVPDYLLCKAGT